MQRLSPKQVEICRRIANGQADKQIAAAMGISINLLRYHIKRIFALTQARNRSEAVVCVFLLSRDAVRGLDERVASSVNCRSYRKR